MRGPGTSLPTAAFMLTSGSPKAVDGPPANTRDGAANGQHSNPAYRRGGGDAVKEAFRAHHGIEAVAVVDVLDKVQQQPEKHAADTCRDAGQDCGDRQNLSIPLR